MKELEYKDVAAFSDAVDDLSQVCDSILNSSIDSAFYDHMVDFLNSLHVMQSKLRRQYESRSLLIYAMKSKRK